MSELAWQKSSFSGGSGSGECIEVAATTAAVHLRESDEPTTVLTTTPNRLAALLRRVKARDLA